MLHDMPLPPHGDRLFLGRMWYMGGLNEFSLTFVPPWKIIARMRAQLIQAADRLAGAFCLVSTAGAFVQPPQSSRSARFPVFFAPTETFHSALVSLREVALSQPGREVLENRAGSREEKLLLKMERIREKCQKV